MLFGLLSGFFFFSFYFENGLKVRRGFDWFFVSGLF